MKLQRNIPLLLLIAVTTASASLPMIAGPRIAVASVGDADWPAWVDTLTIGRWEAVSLNTLSAVDPEDDPVANPNFPGAAPWTGSQNAMISAWGGGAFASGYGTYGTMLLYGGGHSDGNSSAVYGFDMETRLWSRLSDPYTGPFNFPYSDGVYPDGSALPPHTYDILCYHAASNSLALLRSVSESGTSTPSNSVSVPFFQSFDLDTLTWSAPSAHTGDVNSGGHSAYDSTRQLCWVTGGSGSDGFMSYDPASGTTQRFNEKTTLTDSTAAYDPVNDIFVLAKNRTNGAHPSPDVAGWLMSGAIDVNPQVTLNEAGTPPSNRDAGAGWEWSTAKQGFVYYNHGETAVHLFKLTSGTWNTGTWTWSLLTDAGNAVTPPEESGGNGQYSRFMVASYNNGEREVAVVINGVTQSVYAFRIQ